jgi:hypothetical protein
MFSDIKARKTHHPFIAYVPHRQFSAQVAIFILSHWKKITLKITEIKYQ